MKNEQKQGKSIRELLREKVLRSNVWLMSDAVKSNNEALRLARKIYNNDLRKMYEGIKKF
jgi:hypothetical protein